MALLLAVILAAATLIKVDQEGYVEDRNLEQARNHALLGLRCAIADLQEAAGPDQRVTARADLLDGEIVNPQWTGVWNSDDNEGPMRWLVSAPGGSANPATALAQTESAVLVGEGTLKSGASASSIVRAAKIPLENDSGKPKGEFAFWVGDEGVKANIMAGEPEAFGLFEPLSADQLRRLNSSHQARWESLAGSSRETTASERRLLRTVETIPLLEGFESVGERFHDLTPHSAGLLSNVRDGGLQQDLSQILREDYSENAAYANTAPLIPFAPFNTVLSDPMTATGTQVSGPSWGLLRSFYNLPQTAGSENTLLPSIAVRAQTSTEHGIHPIVGMVEMNFSAMASATPSADAPNQFPMILTIQPMVILINPYDVALAAANYDVLIKYPASAAGTTDAGLIITDGNRAKGEAKNFTSPPDIYLARPLHGSNAFGDGEWIKFQIESDGLEPGEARIFSLKAGVDFAIPNGGGAIPLEAGVNFINFATRETPVLIDSVRLADPKIFQLRIRTSDAPEIQLRLAGSDTILQKITDVIYQSSPDYIFHLAEPGSNAIPNRMNLRHSARNTTTEPGPTQDSHSGAKWLALYNVRAPFSRKELAVNQWVTNPIFQGLLSPGQRDGYMDTPHIGQNGFWGQSIWNGETHIPLFTIPRHEIISLGALQHANVSLEAWLPAYAIGNSWASPYQSFDAKDFSYSLNEVLWDAFFFSGIPQDATDWPGENDRLNPRLSPISEFEAMGELSPDQVAAKLTNRGAFNVNSTSPKAWESLLRSFQSMDIPIKVPGENPRVAQTANSQSPRPRMSLPAGPANDRWQGFRALDDSEISELADSIVEQIRLRGPFRSMSEFVNRDLNALEDSEQNLKGALQAAIDSTSINSWWTDNDPHVPPFDERIPGTRPLPILPYPQAEAGPRSTAAPGFLTQADLLQTLAPVLTARSDTFVIRSYGNALNVATGAIESEAWCEAVVQRLPEYVDDSMPPETKLDSAPDSAAKETNEKLGRRFRIIAFRWLNNDQV